MNKKIRIYTILLSLMVCYNAIRGSVFFISYMLDSQKFIENYCQNKKNNTHCKGMCKLAEVSLENSTKSSLKYDFTQLQMDFFLMESYNFLFIYNDFFEKNTFFYYKYPFWENISSKFLQPPV